MCAAWFAALRPGNIAARLGGTRGRAPLRAAAVAAALLAAALSCHDADAATLATVASGYQLPLDLVHAGDGSGRLFVVEQGGIVRVLGAGTASAPFLDLSQAVACCGERGLLGLAFHPRYRANGRLFVDYTRAGDGATVIAELRVAADGARVDPATQRVLLVIPQPFENHNGGALRFGPDGLLYIGMGDGGSANDPGGRAQDPQSLLGKILRIDVDAGVPYGIPAGNPFADGRAGRPEIFALGLRNPWRFTFDRQTGDLVVGDVGQGAWEEVDRLTMASAGANLGWRVVEGRHCTGLAGPVPCGSPSLVAPVLEYDHGDGNCSITGGPVYRGARIAALFGHYLFADFCTGRVWTAVASTAAAWTFTPLVAVASPVSALGEDESGEVYVADYGRGTVLKFVPDAADHGVAIEYRHAGLDHYFLTAEPSDIAALDAHALTGWQRTGETVPAALAPGANVLPLCRFYLPPAVGDSHFLSASPDECAQVRARFGFVEEGPLAMRMALPDARTGACPAAFAPVYRVWNGRPDANHRYTVSPAIRDAMVAAGGVAEGYGPDAVAMCGPQ
jgi:glucose/arabinose dehydrogenase